MMIPEHDAVAALQDLVRHLLAIADDAASSEIRHIPETSLTATITPVRLNAAAITLAFQVADGLLEATFGRYAKSREWVESPDEFRSALSNVYDLSHSVITFGLQEQACFSKGRLMRSSTVIAIGKNRERTILGGSLWSTLIYEGQPARRVQKMKTELVLSKDRIRLRKFSPIDRDGPIFEALLDENVIFDVARTAGAELSSQFEIAFHDHVAGLRIAVSVLSDLVQDAQNLIVEDEAAE